MIRTSGTPQHNVHLREAENELTVDIETLTENWPTRRLTRPWPNGHITQGSQRKLKRMPI